METPLNPITFLYTFDLRGDLDRLPRLYTLIQGQRRATIGQVYLLDLGASCVPEVWPCGVTEGRSTLIALDGMGYDIANVDGVLSAESWDKLREQSLMRMVTRGETLRMDDLLFCVDPPEVPDAISDMRLTVTLSPTETTHLKNGVLSFGAVKGGQLGVVRLIDGTLTSAVLNVPSVTLPDPTITATIDFIRDEARYYERKNPPFNAPPRSLN